MIEVRHSDCVLSVHFNGAGEHPFTCLDYDLSVLRQVNVLQPVLHQQREVHLVHGHVRERRLLHRDRK